MGGGLFILGLVIAGGILIYVTRKSEESEFFTLAKKIPVKFFFFVLGLIFILIGYIVNLERIQGLY